MDIKALTVLYNRVKVKKQHLAGRLDTDHAEWNGSDGNFASNCRKQPETWSLHQRRTPNTSTPLTYTPLSQCKQRTCTSALYKTRNIHLSHIQWIHFTLSGSLPVLHSLTFRSGMENFQHEAIWVLLMVRFSFSTLVRLVLSSGTEINQKSVMTPCASHKRPSDINPSHKSRLRPQNTCYLRQQQKHSNISSVTGNSHALNSNQKPS